MNTIHPTTLREFVENNPKLVTRRESKLYPGLFVLKYAKEVFYKNRWNESNFLLETRGLVVDADYNVVIKPFTKVFNYGENGTTIHRDEVCRAVRKINGFLGVVTYDPKLSSKLIYSTTGSLDSDFCELIEKHVEHMSDDIINRICVGKKMTLMFEICDSVEDPHIIPEEDGAWLIGAETYGTVQANETALDMWAKLIDAKRPEWHYAKFDQIVKLANECDHEGYMVYGLDSGTALKIKSPYYLTSKFLARMSPKKMEAILRDKNTAYQNFDEEFYPLIDYIRNNSACFECLTEQGRLQVIRDFLKDANNK